MDDSIHCPPIEPYLDAIRAFAREYGVERLEVFGSACTAEFDPELSDVDFLVAYPSGYDFGPWAAKLQDLEDLLARTLGRDVDLVMMSALRRKRFAHEAAKTRQVIYDASEIAAVA